MGMDQWRSENDSGAPIWSAKPACTRRREQAESRKTGWLSRGESVIGVQLISLTITSIACFREPKQQPAPIPVPSHSSFDPGLERKGQTMARFRPEWDLKKGEQPILLSDLPSEDLKGTFYSLFDEA